MREEAVRIRPATPKRWRDLERLFGERGACGGCWCMHWRLPARAYEAGKGEDNRSRLQARVTAGPPPGVLAYVGPQAVGWCSVAPRSEFVRLETSRILRPVDDRPVWSIVCLFVDRRHRGRGISVALIEGAVALAGEAGARVVEAYPVEPTDRAIPPVFAFTGIASAYGRAGFREAARRSPTRPIMRRDLPGGAGAG